MEKGNVDQKVIFLYKLRRGQGLGRQPALGTVHTVMSRWQLCTERCLLKVKRSSGGRADGHNTGAHVGGGGAAGSD